ISLSEEKKEIAVIISYWARMARIKLGWIPEFDKFITDYTVHNIFVYSIDYSAFDGNQFICNGSDSRMVHVWDMKNKEKIQSFNKHLGSVFCVQFSPYHHYSCRCNIICSSSNDKTIRFWDIKKGRQLQVFEHTGAVYAIDFSPFNSGRYLCSGSSDKTIQLWDVATSKLLHVFNGHTDFVRCVDISPLQSNNNNGNKSNNIGVIGGNGYTICSGSRDKTIRTWDIETTKQLTVFKGHADWIKSIKYGSNELGNIGCANTILSGSDDKSVRLWDIRYGKQIQVFNGHKDYVNAVEYAPLVINNIGISDGSNVICSGSNDNTIRFWDIRSNRQELYIINADDQDRGIICLKFLKLKNNRIGLCYGCGSGYIRIRG
ncbi:WD-40 repeat protein, partial [Reticulomyxa filosa]